MIPFRHLVDGPDSEPTLIRITGARRVVEDSGGRYTTFYAWQAVYTPNQGWTPNLDSSGDPGYTSRPTEFAPYYVRGGPRDADAEPDTDQASFPAIEVSGCDSVPTNGTVVVWARFDGTSQSWRFQYAGAVFMQITGTEETDSSFYYAAKQVEPRYVGGVGDWDWVTKDAPHALTSGEESLADGTPVKRNPLVEVAGRDDVAVGTVVQVINNPIPTGTSNPTGSFYARSAPMADIDITNTGVEPDDSAIHHVTISGASGGSLTMKFTDPTDGSEGTTTDIDLGLTTAQVQTIIRATMARTATATVSGTDARDFTIAFNYPGKWVTSVDSLSLFSDAPLFFVAPSRRPLFGTVNLNIDAAGVDYYTLVLEDGTTGGGTGPTIEAYRSTPTNTTTIHEVWTFIFRDINALAPPFLGQYRLGDDSGGFTAWFDVGAGGAVAAWNAAGFATVSGDDNTFIFAGFASHTVVVQSRALGPANQTQCLEFNDRIIYNTAGPFTIGPMRALFWLADKQTANVHARVSQQGTASLPTIISIYYGHATGGGAFFHIDAGTTDAILVGDNGAAVAAAFASAGATVTVTGTGQDGDPWLCTFTTNGAHAIGLFVVPHFLQNTDLNYRFLTDEQEGTYLGFDPASAINDGGIYWWPNGSPPTWLREIQGWLPPAGTYRGFDPTVSAPSGNHQKGVTFDFALPFGAPLSGTFPHILQAIANGVGWTLVSDLAYTPGDASKWAGSPPTKIGEALDRLAAFGVALEARVAILDSGSAGKP